jgi:branched-chain amino acid transport system substrate-binding protein
MKTTIILTILALLLAACVQVEEEKPYKFGAVLSLTGPQAFYGEFAKGGIELAVEDLNKAGGINGRPVQIIYEDTASDKTKAVTAAQKLIDIDAVDALFSITTPVSGVVAPVAEAGKTPLIYGSATNSFAINKSYVFKDYPDASDECELLMKEAMKKHEKIAMFGTNAEFTQLCKQGAERVGKLEIYETYAPGETDFKTQLTKIQNSGSTALILLAFSNDCKVGYKQLAELGLKQQLYLPFQAFGCGSPEVTKEYGHLMTNAIGAEITLDEDSTDPAFVDFKKRLEERGWTAQIRGSAIMYDGIMEMAKAYEGCDDKDCAARNLRNLKYQGISGTVSYGGDTIVERDFVLTKFENGKWMVAK